MNTPDADRKALISRAFYDEPIVEQITYSGEAVTFAVNSIAKLRTYNEEAALIQLLTLIRDHYIAKDRARDADDLIRALAVSTPTAPVEADHTTTALTLANPLFISYARKDLIFVNRLRADLHKRSIPYWIDKEGLTPGTPNWERAIRSAIRASSAVLWVVSPAAYESEYVTSEIAVAELHKRKIYPVWADGDNWVACVPLGRHHIQYVDMRRDAYAVGLDQLITELAKSGSNLELPPDAVPDPPTGDQPPRNPYKGLNAFTGDDRQDFFGREALVRSLVARLETQLAQAKERFLAVLGPSGSGKSSVLMAGLLPALENKNAISGSTGWHYLPVMTPGAHPMESLARKLTGLMPSVDPAMLLTKLYTRGHDYLSDAFSTFPPDQRVVLYIDQFEELFTLTESETEREQFIALLTGAASEPSGKVIVLLSLRADFLNYPLNNTQLGKLFNDCSEMVQPMSISELREAIEQPARLPGVALTFDDGLVSDIVFALRGAHTALSGALPLMQFTLERLYAERDGRRLTQAAYERMGGVEGAIGTHSEAVFQSVPPAAQAKLGQVFLPLVNIDENSNEPTRRRASLEAITADADAKQLVDVLVDNGLLQRGHDAGTDNRYLEVTHEALFRSWERLKTWIAESQEDLILLRQVRNAAHDWQTKGRPDFLLWPQERLVPVYAMRERLKPELNEVEEDFIEPEQNRLLRELETLPRDETSHERRRDIGDRLAVIGDTRDGVGEKDGLPDVFWLPVKGSAEAVMIKTDDREIGPVLIPDFYVARYLVTYSQFHAFLDARDGFQNEDWWRDMPEEYKRQQIESQRTNAKNAPRDSVSWYQAVAFARWMNHRYHGLTLQNPGDISSRSHVIGETAEIRLPTEWEWQWMAQGGEQAKAYPWGEWQLCYGNTSEAGLIRTTAVGMYPHGKADCGALDVSGNLFEWCLNDYENPEIKDGYGNYERKVLRGGSFNNNRRFAAASSRLNLNPNFRVNDYGLRLVACPIGAL
jgi:formylglycine-generating enzyme required for sulfatase activity/energy-coupling factor transporter ATP-binding protein EcfA2